METFSNIQQTSPAEVMIGVREPFNKNCVWIHTHDGVVDIKIFDKGWKSIYTTLDGGLSTTSQQQVSDQLSKTQNILNEKIKKQLGKYSTDSLTLVKRQKELEDKIAVLEDKFEKLLKKVRK